MARRAGSSTGKMRSAAVGEWQPPPPKEENRGPGRGRVTPGNCTPLSRRVELALWLILSPIWDWECRKPV